MSYADPERKRAHDHEYHVANREKRCAYSRQHYRDHREARLATQQRYDSRWETRAHRAMRDLARNLERHRALAEETE